MITLLLSLVLIISNMYAMEVKSPNQQQMQRFVVDFSNAADCPPLTTVIYDAKYRNLLVDRQHIHPVDIVDPSGGFEIDMDFIDYEKNGGFVREVSLSSMPRINVAQGQHFRLSIDLSKEAIEFPLCVSFTALYNSSRKNRNGFNEYNRRFKLFLEKIFNDKTIILDYKNGKAMIGNENICKKSDEPE